MSGMVYRIDWKSQHTQLVSVNCSTLIVASTFLFFSFYFVSIILFSFLLLFFFFAEKKNDYYYTCFAIHQHGCCRLLYIVRTKFDILMLWLWWLDRFSHLFIFFFSCLTSLPYDTSSHKWGRFENNKLLLVVM